MSDPTDAIQSDERRPTAVDDPTDVAYVGPATATVLRESAIEAAEIVDRAVSYRQLVQAGVNPGVAARIRREHSLPWSFDSESDDLDRRSTQIRGLSDDERAWVAASAGDWEATDPDPAPAETDGSGDAVAVEAAWRERSRPTPVDELDGIGAAYADQLSTAGITSVRSLATADPERVATVLDLPESRVEAWHEAARAQYD